MNESSASFFFLLSMKKQVKFIEKIRHHEVLVLSTGNMIERQTDREREKLFSVFLIL